VKSRSNPFLEPTGTVKQCSTVYTLINVGHETANTLLEIQQHAHLKQLYLGYISVSTCFLENS